ncbi:GAF domain-containing protein [Cellulosimicrobium cellulans]|uniref:GAF domain-containing protein n=1 Tax=Cellulosimicrobium cellulans TaxID=1710 RepID=UPI00130DC22A|nr:GAF domain-containing protein [Cellulosimicrobium cellulans]
MTASTDVDPTSSYLDAFAAAAAARVGVPTECSIILRNHHLLDQVASSSERAARCDRAEVSSGEGPCVVAIQQLRGELVPDVLAEERWPEWRAAATEAGFRSTAALPGQVDAETTVALNLYAETVDPWDRDTLVRMDRFVQEVAEAIRTRGLTA